MHYFNCHSFGMPCVLQHICRLDCVLPSYLFRNFCICVFVYTSRCSNHDHVHTCIFSYVHKFAAAVPHRIRHALNIALCLSVCLSVLCLLLNADRKSKKDHIWYTGISWQVLTGCAFWGQRSRSPVLTNSMCREVYSHTSRLHKHWCCWKAVALSADKLSYSDWWPPTMLMLIA